jgi:hypothetical protein
MKMRPPSKTRSGRLSREDVRLWVEVAKTVTPKPDAALPEHQDDQIEGAAAPPPPLPAKVSTPVIRTATPEKSKPLPLAPLERRLRQRLSRGLAIWLRHRTLHSTHPGAETVLTGSTFGLGALDIVPRSLQRSAPLVIQSARGGLPGNPSPSWCLSHATLGKEKWGRSPTT